MTERCPQCGGILTEPSHIHRQVPISAEGRHAHVDEGIAELIEGCWRIGIVTAGSCQENPETGLAAIAFAPGSAEPFVGVGTTEDLDDPATFQSLGWRIRGTGSPQDWRWQPGGFAWGVSFRAYFPPSDIEELTRRVWRWV